MIAPEIRPAAVRAAEPTSPEFNAPPAAAYLPPAEALRRIIARNRRLPPTLPSEPDLQDSPGWFEWYERGERLNRARSLAGK